MRRPSRDSDLPLLLVIAGAIVIAYLGSFAGTWISDDVDLIAVNPLIRSLSLGNLRTLAGWFEANINYIPLTYLTFAIDHQLFGLHPAGFHATNLVLHVANAIVVYVVMRRIGDARGIAACVALLWALHPVQVESVAWISERKNLLSTFFFLLAFAAYVRCSDAPRARGYVLVFVLYLAALLSKVNTIVLPAITVAYELILRRRLRRPDVAVAIGLLACGAALAWVNLHDNPSHGVAYHGGSLTVTLRTISPVIPRYLVILAAPFDLASYYPVPLRGSWLDPTVAASVAGIAALAAATLWLAWRGVPAGFWLAWFGIALSPMLNLVPFPALMNDRYLYVPSLGIVAVLVQLADTALRRLDLVRLGLPLTAAAALGLGALTFVRVPVFHDELSLWADWALKTAYISANKPYGAQPRTDEQRLLREALARHPERAVLHNNLGAIAFEEGRLDVAIPLLERAYALDPSDPAIALNLGRAYLIANRLDDAEKALTAAVALEPPSFFAHYNLATIHFRRGDLARARAELDVAKTIRRDPYLWGKLEQQLTAGEGTLRAP